MAQIEGGGDSGSHKKGPGVKKAKKLSTRVDMTPMVDLGFLLITFFIFTTTMSSPKALNLNMPKDTKNEEELNKAKESGALTIMLGKNNGVYYYEGQLLPDGSNFKSANFATIRDEIINKKKDKYYIVYHRRPIGDTDGNHRVTCIDEMNFDTNGNILPVKITNEGVKAEKLK